MQQEKQRKQKQLDKTYIFNNFQAAFDKFEDLERADKVPDDFYCVLYHRRHI